MVLKSNDENEDSSKKEPIDGKKILKAVATGLAIAATIAVGVLTVLSSKKSSADNDADSDDDNSDELDRKPESASIFDSQSSTNHDDDDDDEYVEDDFDWEEEASAYCSHDCDNCESYDVDGNCLRNLM